MGVPIQLTGRLVIDRIELRPVICTAGIPATSNAADNGPDQGQPLAAAGTWRADETQREPEMRIGVRGGAIRCFSAPHHPIGFSPAASAVTARARRCPPSPAPAQQQAVRSGRCADLLSVCLPARLAVLFWLFAGQGADRGGERGRGGRLLEITEITATMEDKMLMEKVLNNTCRTCTAAIQMESLDMFLSMYGSTDRCSSAPSP